MILSEELWKSSGHWDHYHENMYFTQVDEQGFAVKPMNCPGACLVFRSRRRSYRELPLRLAEFGHVHRHELSGVLHGLFRVRAFTQDDAHIFCRLDQVHDEVRTVIEFIDRFYGRFGFDQVKTKLSTRPAKAAGTIEMWDARRGGARAGARRPRLRAQSGRRCLLRPEDRLPGHRLDGPVMAAGHVPARFLHARGLRSDLHIRDRHRRATRHHPPRDPRDRSNASSGS